MNKDDIVVPILKAINDLRDEVRENRREIQKNTEAIERNRVAIEKNAEAIERNRVAIERNRVEIEKNRAAIEENKKRWDRHEIETKKDRGYIKEILVSFQTSVEDMYSENKGRIDRLEEQFKVINA